MSHARAPQQRFAWGETRLLMDYLAATYSGRRWMTNIQVGPLDPHVPRAGLSEPQKRMMGKYRRYADAIVPLDRELMVVETTMFKAVHKIGPLLEYVDLVPQTPELAEFAGWRVRGELVSPIPDPRAQQLCARLGLAFKIFVPTWLDQFTAQYERHFRRAPLSDVKREFLAPAEEAPPATRGEP